MHGNTLKDAGLVGWPGRATRLRGGSQLNLGKLVQVQCLLAACSVRVLSWGAGAGQSSSAHRTLHTHAFDPLTTHGHKQLSYGGADKAGAWAEAVHADDAHAAGQRPAHLRGGWTDTNVSESNQPSTAASPHRANLLGMNSRPGRANVAHSLGCICGADGRRRGLAAVTASGSSRIAIVAILRRGRHQPQHIDALRRHLQGGCSSRCHIVVEYY